MSLQFLQREVDYLFDLIIKDPDGEGNKYLRNLLNKETHIGTFDAKKVAKDLEMHMDGRKSKGTDVYPLQGQEELLKKYTKEVLAEFKRDSRIPQKVGAVKVNGNYRVLLMTKDTNEITVSISLIGTSGNPFNYFRDKLNAPIQAKVIKSKPEFKDLFGLENVSDSNFDKAAEARVKQTQQIGHVDGGGVVNKKIQSVYAGIFGGDESDITQEVILEDIPEMSSGGTYLEAFENLLEPKVTLEHAQQYRIKEGKFNDNLVIKLSVEGKEANQKKANIGVGSGKSEGTLGVELSKLIKALQKDLKKELDNVKVGTRKERSPSPIEIVGHMVLGGSKLQSIMKNKSLKQKLSTPYAKKIPKQKKPIKASASTQLRGKKPSFSMGLPTRSLRNKLGPKKQKRVETGTSTQDAMVARAYINSRISKQVAANMGRPQLENRTGRFAESVNVVNASSAGQQTHFDYTYNPLYRVFEGGRDFSPNYDPRPLIERSIRQLAAARLETKFTLRRV
jgi:hypothetical protein